VPGKPSQVRGRRLFCYDGAFRVDEAGKEGIVVGIDGLQASTGKLGGDR
jgi:hypothetical protein